METKQKTLVKVDKIGIDHTKKAIQDRVDLLNGFVEVVEKNLKAKLTDAEKHSLKDEGIDFVMQWLKPKFKFPDADEAFNLQAMGIDISPIQKYWDANRKRWRGLPVEIDKDSFTVPDVDNLTEVKRHYHYAKNKRQEKAFKEAKEICKALNELLDKGFITGISRDLCKGFDNIRFGNETNTYNSKLKNQFYPNEMRILNL